MSMRDGWHSQTYGHVFPVAFDMLGKMLMPWIGGKRNTRKPRRVINIYEYNGV